MRHTIPLFIEFWVSGLLFGVGLTYYFVSRYWWEKLLQQRDNHKEMVAQILKSNSEYLGRLIDSRRELELTQYAISKFLIDENKAG